MLLSAEGEVRAKVTSLLSTKRRSSAVKVTMGSSVASSSLPWCILTGTMPKSLTTLRGTRSITSSGMTARERST